MECSRIDALLDAYMDHSLTADDEQRLKEHCISCEECAKRLRATREMMQLFSEMVPEAEVPLKVQAAWRSAVKSEVSKRRFRHFAHLAGGIAAALVVVVGVTFTVGNRDVKLQSEALESEMANRSFAVIEADGQKATESVSTAVSRAMPMHEFNMVVKDVRRTSDYIADLVNEYEGEVDVQQFDEGSQHCANLYIELTAENASEFVNAVSHFDVSSNVDAAGSVDFAGADRVSLLLVLKEE